MSLVLAIVLTFLPITEQTALLAKAKYQAPGFWSYIAATAVGSPIPVEGCPFLSQRKVQPKSKQAIVMRTTPNC